MIFPSLYIDFIIYFHGSRDYFECHEVLEKHWKKNGMKRNSVWVGLIQMAVSFYHYRRHNVRGALKMMEKAIQNLTTKRKEIHSLGIHHAELIHILSGSFNLMKSNKRYDPIDLPILDSKLLSLCKKHVRLNGYAWGNKDDVHDKGIIHKHMLRHRTKDST